ncbi:type II secretion system minor pseudopilin GspK [Pseudomaricurvus sp. HS19]|uniref:type II secretion system minor pseudopilin GspK n=1 Tax=Pseudomaricurvus sp. HS19 TaxID=2692626 RepID=UPI00136CFC3F|nr:type II secretion system minor pseudopilin GspK [Pseudomaricurvus sp. HS19]MYM62971.1 type II secretion system minor pseudopilin GspK [Pseudomaricurvus sp. HS19]
MSVTACGKSQRGVALISMLLVFTLVVLLVAGVVTRSSFDIRRTSQQLQREQAWQYALGAEALARQILHQDWQDDQQQQDGDSLAEPWAQPRRFEPDDGEMRMVVEDLQGRFNLNSLVNAGGNANATRGAVWQRLLLLLGVSGDTGALTDWLDRDTTPTASNSEDSFFLSQSPAYRSADGALDSVLELQALRQFDQSQLAALLPHVADLPPATSAINPNTASAEVLSSLNPRLDGTALVAARNNNDGFKNVAELLQHPVTAGVELDPQLFTVQSEYFLVWVVARYQQQHVYLRSLLHRDPATGALQLLWRNRQPPSNVHNPLQAASGYYSAAIGNESGKGNHQQEYRSP